MKHVFKQFATAIAFLTILPVPHDESQQVSSIDLAKSFCFFPLVGLILGIICLIPLLMVHGWMPTMLSAVLITSMLAFLTRGLHLDGLADLADGLGGGYTPQRRLEIMKDSRIGTFGALTLILSMLLKVAALHALIRACYWTPVILTPIFSRLTMVLAAYKSPYARVEGGLGKPFVTHMTTQEPLIAMVFSIATALLVTPSLAIFFTFEVLLCAALFRFIGRRWLGGMTGDVLGATNEVTEIVLFSSAACTLSFL